MLKGIKIGQPYYSIRVYAQDGAMAEKYINQGSNLEAVIEKTGNYFKTEAEAQNLADRINKAILKTKESK